MARSATASPQSAAKAGSETKKVKLRIEHQPENSMSKLQMEVADRMKTASRKAGDQKSRVALLLAVLCTHRRCSVDRRASSERIQPLGQSLVNLYNWEMPLLRRRWPSAGDDVMVLLECVGAVIAILCSVKNRILEPHAHTG